MQIVASVQNGTFSIEKKKEIAEILKQYEGKNVIVEIDEIEKKRSLAQNRYFHAVVRQVMDELEQWGTIEECKCWIKLMCGAITPMEVNHAIFPIYEETSKMTKKRFSEFMGDVKRFLYMDHNIVMIDPEFCNISNDYFL